MGQCRVENVHQPKTDFGSGDSDPRPYLGTLDINSCRFDLTGSTAGVAGSQGLTARYSSDTVADGSSRSL